MGETFTRVGNVLLLTRDSPASLKRNRTLLDVEDEGEVPFIPLEFDTPEDSINPLFRYTRNRRCEWERFRADEEDDTFRPIRTAFAHNEEWFWVQEGPSGIRMSFLGKDGLDDAPTPVSSPWLRATKLPESDE